MIVGLTLMVLLSGHGAPLCDGVVFGRVLDSKSGEALSRTRVDMDEDIAPVRTDESGRFRFEGLCPGPKRIRAVRPDYSLRERSFILEGSREIDLLISPMNVSQGEDLVVRAPRLQSADTRSVVSLEGDALLQTRGKHLADALADLPGVSVLRSGATAKPIVRGQHGSRVLVLYDGVRHESQDWALDHGPEIDPFATGSIRVIKGSAGVRYGPDALAGVLLIDPPEMLQEPGIRLYTHTVGALNGLRGTQALRIDGNNSAVSGLSWRLDGNYSRGASLETPNYPLDNTGVQEWNVGGALEYRGDCWRAEFSYRHNDQRNGFCLCVRNESTTDFDAQVLRDRPYNSDLYQVEYSIERPFGTVSHDVSLARGIFELGDVGELEATYAFQYNDRKEYETIRGQSGNAQIMFQLRTHSADLLFRRTPAEIGNGLRLEGLTGISGMLQENVYRGWPLLSDYRSLSGGVFALERLVWSRAELEAGVRFDHMTRHAYIPEKTFQGLVREERIDPESCDVRENDARCGSVFNAGTLSLGGLVRLSDSVLTKLDLSTATRLPTIDEQYINGTAPSFPIMARGLGELGPETSWSLSATLGVDLPWLVGELSVYGSYIDEYIYLAPELREDGTIRTDVLIQGRFPRFAFDAIDAVFYGFDANATVRVGALDLGVQGSVVRAKDTENDTFLLFIPPDRVRAEATYHLSDMQGFKDSHVSVNATMVAKQNNVSPKTDFAPAPDGYALFGAKAGTSFKWRGQRYLLSLELQNMLDTRYRDYTSLLRYYADEPGRQVFLRLGTELSL